LEENGIGSAVGLGIRSEHTMIVRLAGALGVLALLGGSCSASATTPSPKAASPTVWTKARIAKSIEAALVVKCPMAELHKIADQDAKTIQLELQNCDTGVAHLREIIACGITSKCVTSDGLTIPVNEATLRTDTARLQLYEKGYPARFAKCARALKVTFSCGAKLATEHDIDPQVPANGHQYALCLAVTARATHIRWKITHMSIWVTSTTGNGDPYVAWLPNGSDPGVCAKLADLGQG
jgi:hypothetical protein